MLGGKKTPRSRPQERARAADAKPNASKPPTQAPGGKPRARRKGAKATRQPVARTHERARPAAKPTRRTAQRRPAGAGVAPPPPHAQQRHDHASGRRRGGAAGGDGAGRAALGRRSQPPTPCHQRRTPHRAAQAARPTQTEATSTGRRTGARPPDAVARRTRNKLPCPAPRAAQGRADGQPGKPPGAKRTGATAQRGAILAACAPLWRFFSAVGDIQCHPHVRTPQNGEKSLDLGLVLCALIVLYLFGGV